jgi:quinol monooxygenase YgiN
MILIDVTLNTRTETRAEFLALLESTMRNSQAEAGCLIYRFTADLNDPLKFYLLELWQDEAAILGHVKTAHFAEFLRALPTLGMVEASVARNGAMEPYKVPR